MNDPIKISDLPIYQQGFAKECDKDGNGILETTDSFDEISLFNQKIKDVMDGKLTSGGNSIFSQQDVAPADAWRQAQGSGILHISCNAYSGKPSVLAYRLRHLHARQRLAGVLVLHIVELGGIGAASFGDICYNKD